MCVQCSWRAERALDLLVLELQMVVSCHVVVGNKTLEKAAGILTEPPLFFFLFFERYVSEINSPLFLGMYVIYDLKCSDRFMVKFSLHLFSHLPALF